MKEKQAGVMMRVESREQEILQSVTREYVVGNIETQRVKKKVAICKKMNSFIYHFLLAPRLF